MIAQRRPTPAKWSDLMGPAHFNLPRAIEPGTKVETPFQIYQLPSGRFLAAWRCSRIVGLTETEYAGTVRRAFNTFDEAVTFCVIGED